MLFGQQLDPSFTHAFEGLKVDHIEADHEETALADSVFDQISVLLRCAYVPELQFDLLPVNRNNRLIVIKHCWLEVRFELISRVRME